jgi:hypothetical protein
MIWTMLNLTRSTMTHPRNGLARLEVTWISKLLAGRATCEWAAWYKAHFDNYEKVFSSFDSASWTVRHTDLVRLTRNELEAAGYSVRLENQNKFSLLGSFAELNGKPDIIAERDGRYLIVDCKAAKPHAAHVVQVMIYMWAIPFAQSRYKSVAFDGRVVYERLPGRTEDRFRQIYSPEIDDQFIYILKAALQRIGGEEPCLRLSSLAECRYCEISKSDCAERVEKEEYEEPPETDPFELPMLADANSAPRPAIYAPLLTSHGGLSRLIAAEIATLRMGMNSPAGIGAPSDVGALQSRIDGLESQLLATEKWCEELAAKIAALEPFEEPFEAIL